MARITQNFSDSNNGWDVTIAWDCEYGDTSTPVYIEINQNSYNRTFQLVSKSNTNNRYNSGATLSVGSEYLLYVYKSGSYSQQKGPFTITAPIPTYTVSYNANGGSGAPSSQTKTHNVTLTLSSTRPTRTGYNFLGWSTSRTATSASYSAGGSFTSNSDTTLYAVWDPKSYTLSTNSDSNSSILVSRQSTKKSGAPTGALSSSDSIYYDDVLKVQFGANEGYNISTHTVNNSAFTSGGTFTVTGNVSVASTAVVKSFTLSVNMGTGTNIVVNRTSSPKQGASTGVLSSGATIFYSDVLSFTFTAQTGYENATGSVNGSPATTGSTVTVTDKVSVSSSANVQRFTLSVSQGTGSAIQVTRTSSPKQGAGTGVLSSGDYIYYSDVLVIYFDKDTGYNLATHKVNNNTFTSGSQHTVTGAVSVSSTAVLVEYALSVGTDDGITVTVNRTSSPLGKAPTGVIESGTPLYYNDRISITFTPKNGYNVATHSVNGSTFTSGSIHTVSGDVTVVGSSSVKEFTLTINAGTGSKIVVKRNNSALGGGSIGQILSGAKIYFGDVLQVTFTPNDGYGITSSTVNGSEFVSGGSFTVEGNVTVESTASAADFRLTLDIATGSSIVVERTESPNGGGSIGKIASGERLYYNDVLKITFGVSASDGYNLTSHTVNDENFESGYMYTVKTSITVKTTTEVISYSLSIASDQGSTVSVTRTKSPKGNAELKDLTSGEVIYFSDELTILFSSKDGYVITKSTLNGENFSSGGSVEVKSDIAVVCASEIKSYTLSIAPENGFTITVTRTASPNKGAALTELTSGATIYYEDALSYQFATKTGYTISSRTLNGASVSASGNHVVRENVSFSATASVRSFKLSITKDAGCIVAVNRTSSPLKGANLVSLLDGATIYYNDVLRIALTSLTGFEFTTNTVNNTPFLSGDKTVTANVTIVALTKQMGLVYIKDEEGNSRYQVYINEGTEISPDFQLYVPYVKTKEVDGWELCS